MRISAVLRIAITLLLFLGCMESQVASPKDVVQQFVNLDVEGLRLTPEGWTQADALFTKHTKPSLPTFVVVIGRHYGVSQDMTRKDYFVLGYDDIGHIDTGTLRFMLTPVVPMVRYSTMGYTVTRADATGKNGSVSSDWRIEGAQPTEMHLTADSAIRWVTQRRDKTKDPTIRRNADQTIVKLKPYR
jgi:hypothetical protein